jgi:DNA-binding FrmR family transcriptional regulator
VSARDPEARLRIVHRLRRAQGQLAAVIAAVDEGKPCRDVITQLAAVSKALDRAGVVLISNAMQECLAEPEAPDHGDKLTLDEFEKLFLMLA